MSGIRILPINHREPELARQIHALQMAAYALEARLLSVTRFEPLDRSVADIRESAEQFIGAFDKGALVAAISIERQPDASPDVVHIASLVVAPTHLRRGVGRQLVQSVIAAHGRRDITVSTAVRNMPALALYAELGFAEGQRQTVGAESIEIVRLHRRARGICGRG